MNPGAGWAPGHLLLPAVAGMCAGTLPVLTVTAAARRRARSVIPRLHPGLASSRPGPARLAASAGLLVALYAPATALLGCVLALSVHLAVRRSRRRRSQRDVRAQVVSTVLATAASLRSGLPAERALAVACSADPAVASLLLPVVRAAGAGEDVAAALLETAGRPGAEGLVRVAVCWRVASTSGAPLADALDDVADALRAEDDLRGLVEAELSAARSTCRVLAGLPVVAVLVESVSGIAPVSVALGGAPGRACLAAAAGCAAAGFGWFRLLVRRAQPVPPL